MGSLSTAANGVTGLADGALPQMFNRGGDVSGNASGSELATGPAHVAEPRRTGPRARPASVCRLCPPIVMLGALHLHRTPMYLDRL